VKGQLRITEMYAFVIIDEDGTEGIPAFQAGDTAMPMVGADTARVDQLRPIAQHIASQISKPIEVIRFTVRESVEVINP